jgi:predicted HicB family RNase H-like nuclease
MPSDVESLEESRKLIALRILPTVHRQAKIAAVTAGKTLGQWLEEAIREKAGREEKENDKGK